MKRLVRGIPVVVALFVALAVPVLTASPARAAGGFHFAEAALEASEGQALVRVSVQRTDLPVSRASVDYRTEPGTASPGTDYVEAAGTLTFGVGETYASFTVFLRDDDVGEEPETVVLLLQGAATAESRLTIQDDDFALRTVPSGEGAGAPSSPTAAASVTNDARPAPAAATNVAAVPVAAPTRPAAAVRRAPAATPRRVVVRQNPVTPFELRPAPRDTAGTATPTDVDAGLAVLAALVLARVAAEVWFRTRSLAA